jgi:glycosyltransferase involved in cell wall biosynthesis
MQFSIAITVFESEYFLPHALETVLAQTLPPEEILVYSDGPSPVTAGIVEALRVEMPVRYEALPRHAGLHGNHLRRRALEQARSSHVCILGHDCLLYPTYLAAHAENLKETLDGLSVVSVAYWRGDRRDGRQPKNLDLMSLRDGEIDLLCIAYPRELSLKTDSFGEDMQSLRYADFLSFDRLRRLTVPQFRPGPVQAAHF